MKKIMISMAMGIVLTISLIASAGTWTPFGQIESVTEYGKGMRVTGLDLSANPAKCSAEEYGHVEIDNRTSAEIDRLNKMLLSAFLSGRNVKVKLRSDQCIENRPVIYAVKIK